MKDLGYFHDMLYSDTNVFVILRSYKIWKEERNISFGNEDRLVISS